MGKNWMGGCALFSGRSGAPSNTKSPGPRHTAIPSGILVHPAVWPQRTLAENWAGGCARRPIGGGGAGSPSNTVSPMVRHTSVSSGILVHTDASSRLATIEMGRKLREGTLPPFGQGSCVPMKHNVAWAEAYHQHTKWHHNPCSHLATTDIGQKLGAPPSLWGGGAVPI